MAKFILLFFSFISWQSYAANISSQQLGYQEWPFSQHEPTVTAASRYTGLYAFADRNTNTIEVFNIHQELIIRIDNEQLTAKLPTGFNISSENHGPSGLAFSSSGRLLFIALKGAKHETILRLNTGTFELHNFIEVVEAQPSKSSNTGLAHFNGELWVGTQTGSLQRYRAEKNDINGVYLANIILSDTPIKGMAIDSANKTLYASTEHELFKLSEEGSPEKIASHEDIQGLTYGRNYGGEQQGGLYILSDSYNDDTAPTSTLHFISQAMLNEQQSITPNEYTQLPYTSSIAATADGRMLLASQNSLVIEDLSDLRLGYEEWLLDEYQQYMTLVRSLLWPSPMPEGWVMGTEASQQAGQHKNTGVSASAGWAVLVLIAHEELFNESGQEQVRLILERHAGTAADGIIPELTSDGLFFANYDTIDGRGFAHGGKGEGSIYPTAKLIHAALRAKEYYADDTVIEEAANLIISKQKNYSDYLREFGNVVMSGTDFGPLPGYSLREHPGYQESYLFAELAGAMDPMSTTAYQDWWQDHDSFHPLTSYLDTEPVIKWNISAFVEQYGHIVFKNYRESAGWQSNFNNLYAHYAAWTDDNATDYLTVFSAGAGNSLGYNADKINYHPDTITHFPAILGFGMYGDSRSTVGGYFAYRDNLRQKMKGVDGVTSPNGTIGANLLTRYSNDDPQWNVVRIALADLVYGYFGLAEQIQGHTGRKGVIDSVIARNSHPEDFQLKPLSDIPAIPSETQGELMPVENADFADRLEHWTTRGDFQFFTPDTEGIAIDGRSAEIRNNKEVTSEFASLNQVIDLTNKASMTPFVIRAQGRIQNAHADDNAYLKVTWYNKDNRDSLYPAQYSNILNAQSYPYQGAKQADIDFELLTYKPVDATHALISFEVERNIDVEPKYIRYLVDNISMRQISQPLTTLDDTWTVENGESAQAAVQEDKIFMLIPNGTIGGDYVDVYRDFALDSNDPLGTRYIVSAMLNSDRISDSELRVYGQIINSGDPSQTRTEGGDVLSKTVKNMDIFYSSRRLTAEEDTLRVFFKFKRKGSRAKQDESAVITNINVRKQNP
ncbi:hypothetical protein [Psychromonas ossibalaenae]|uniref:hypothetical protein n=1 Tax=Psychromonas ossibalaenae TaxID=444922 RepID=UPI0003645DA3|nr:hypothetical protein [Psychromonas ossibalaenae]